MADTHHLHVDTDDQGHQVIHCLRCGASSHSTIPAEPCPHPEVAVACCAFATNIVIEAGEDNP